jgi:hypothetical protein
MTVEKKLVLTWDEGKNKRAFEQILHDVEQENLDRQRKAERDMDPPRHSREVIAGMAFNVDLTVAQMIREMNRDKTHFVGVYRLAIGEGLGWEEAEKRYNEGLLRGEIFIDKVGQNYNSRFAKDPKPDKIFTGKEKKTRKKSKLSLFNRANGWLNWKKASDAVNTEEATPLDE